MALNPNRSSTDFTFAHDNQVDEYGPSVGNVDVIQQAFDSRAIDNLEDLNNIKDTLRSILDGDSGSHNIGSADITGITGSTVYDQLVALNDKIENESGEIESIDLRVTQNENDIVSINLSVSTIESDISTIESDINTLDGTTVKTSGNETISGTKTFSSSPNVPQTPTFDSNAASKKYVDDSVGDAVVSSIPDGSIDDVKLSNAAGQLKDRFEENQTKIIEDATILSSSWTDDTGSSGYWIYDYSNSNIDTDTVVDVVFDLTSLEDATDVKPVTQEFNGYVRLYSDGQPTSDLTADIIIEKVVV